MRKSFFLQLIFMFLAQIVFAYNKVLPEEEPLEFQEVWGYVIEGFEEEEIPVLMKALLKIQTFMQED